MLQAAGLGTARDSFGGGAGEDQFASFLVQEHAMAMVRAGGIGLSEQIYEALKERENVRPSD
jgi:flagellar protein FlgJ